VRGAGLCEEREAVIPFLERGIATWRDILQYPPEMKLTSPPNGNRLSRYLCFLACGMAGFFSVASHALELSVQASAVDAASSVAAEFPPTEGFIDPVLDRPHAFLSDQFVSFADKVDRFFGGERNYQEGNRSVLQLDLTRIFQEDGDQNVRLTGRAKIHLPTTEQRLHLLLESNPDQTTPGAPGQPGQTSLFREFSGSDSYGAALRIENPEDSPWRISADAGLKLEQFALPPFVRSRASYTAQAGNVGVKFAQSVFWYGTVGAGENTQLDADHYFGEKLLFRATSGATWLHDKQNFDLRQDLSLFQTLNEESSLLYQYSAIGVSQPSAVVSEYVALMLYRRRIYREWMFLELSPQLHYPRADDYREIRQYVVRLEMLFSK